MTLIPTIYNADTLGIRPDLVGRPITQLEGLLDPEFKGKTSILNIPSIGIMDAAMVCESTGDMKYGDKGNMTKAEIDKTIDDPDRGQEGRPVPRLLEDLRRVGEPDGLGRGRDPVDVVARRHRGARRKGIACVYQPLKEGYRAWGGGLGLAKHLTGSQLDAAYEYINWYLSGWVGGFLNRQGYYSAVLETAKADHERRTSGATGWKASPPPSDIMSPDGKLMEKAGAVRDGGSF